MGDVKQGKIAIMFSGQGAQHVGMGKELYDNSEAARAVFECAEKIRPGTIKQCFDSSEEELRKTENTQPCVYCVDLAAAAALKEAGVTGDMLAGFSLGELAALAFSGALTYEDGFRLVCKRAKLMQKASEKVSAGMVAVLKLSDDEVTRLCGELQNVYPVNFNCPGQVVVAGSQDGLEELKARVKEAGGKAMPLKVSGGFHSPFMAEAESAFAKVLDTFEFASPSVPLYSNVTAKPYDGNFKELLAKQLCNPVRWHVAVNDMIANGADTFIEVGPGKTLCGFVPRISDSDKIRAFNVEDVESLKKTIEGVRSGA